MVINHPVSVAASILLSAGTYLFDFARNMVVVAEYGRRYARFLRLEKQAEASIQHYSYNDYIDSSSAASASSICSAECRHQTSELTGYFTAMVAVLFCSHTLNALVFWFKFSRSTKGNYPMTPPFRAAYFLPIVHLWRLVHLLWRTLSFKGVQDLRSDEMNGLYNILGSAFESVPMLILQFCAYIVLVKVGLLIRGMTSLFKVSVAASLLCSAYNGGTAIQTVAKNGASTILQKLNVMVSAGAFTMFATVNRCLTYANMLVWQREHFWEHRTERSRARFHPSDAIPLIFLGGSVIAYWLFYWLMLPLPRSNIKRLQDSKRCLASLAMAYMSILLGPLYCILSEARSPSSFSYCNDHLLSFHIITYTVVAVNIFVDAFMLGLTFSFGNLPLIYLIISLISAIGCLLSIAWFIAVDYKLLLAQGHYHKDTSPPISMPIIDDELDTRGPIRRIPIEIQHLPLIELQHPAQTSLDISDSETISEQLA